MSKKTLRKSNSDKVLTVGAGGSFVQTPINQPLQSLAPEESPKPSLPLAQQEHILTSTNHGDQRLNDGEKSAPGGANASLIPNLTLAGTANWVLTLLSKRGLIEFGLVHGANGGYYQARFPVSTWYVENNVLKLKAG